LGKEGQTQTVTVGSCAADDLMGEKEDREVREINGILGGSTL